MIRHDRAGPLAAFLDHFAAVSRFLTRRMGSADQASDVTQETHIRLASLEMPREEIADPRAYAFRIAGTLAGAAPLPRRAAGGGSGAMTYSCLCRLQSRPWPIVHGPCEAPCA